MKLKLYSVFDSKTACFSAPYTGLSDAAAVAVAYGIKMEREQELSKKE